MRNILSWKHDPLLRELRERLIHVEGKLDALRVASDGAVTLPREYAGHPDQVYGHITYAQHGDDLILLSIFDSIGMSHPSYLDIGAHHPFDISNTALLYARGSRGVNVEANPNLIDAFRIYRPDDINLNCGVAEVSGEMTFYMIDAHSGRNSFNRAAVEQFVKESPEFSIRERRNIQVCTVDDIIEKNCGGTFPDLLSIDVEGMEEGILKNISYDRWAPKVICAESCAMPGRHGATMTGLLSSRGYFCLLKNRGNSFFVQNQYRALVTGCTD